MDNLGIGKNNFRFITFSRILPNKSYLLA